MRGNLKIHIQAMHERLEYHCNLCSYKASTPRSLKLHEKSKHVIWTVYKLDINYKFEYQSEQPFTFFMTLRFTYFLELFIVEPSKRLIALYHPDG